MERYSASTCSVGFHWFTTKEVLCDASGRVDTARPRSGAGLRAAESVGPDSATSEPNGTAYDRHREKRSNQRALESHTKKHVFKLMERTVSASEFPQGHLRPQMQEGWLPPVGSPPVSPFLQATFSLCPGKKHFTDRLPPSTSCPG